MSPLKLMNPLSLLDLKSIKLIEKKIGLFQNHKIDLIDLVVDLNAILSSLENVEDSWKNDCQIQINTLELIHDGIEDGSIARWQGNFKADLDTAIAKLKKMTVSLLDEYIKTNDPNISDSATVMNSDWLMCPKCNDAWESDSLNAMVICPKCEQAFHNPRA